MANRVLSEAQAAFAAHLPRRGAVLVGVSGGADSLALLDLAAACIPDARRRLKVVHVHHGLRSRDADLDQRLVQAQARRLGLSCWCYRSQVNQLAAKRRMTLEEAGRMVRHACLVDAAWHWRAAAVLLAHHLDDQAETVLAQLLRGAGGQGLAAMRPAKLFPHPAAPAGLLLLRPLLGVRKRELEAYCRSRGLRWREDRSNRSQEFTRNRIRRRLLPMLERAFNPQIVHRLGALAAGQARDDDYLARLAERALRRLTRPGPAGTLTLDRAGFLRLPQTLKFRVAGLAWDQLGVPHKSSLHLERVVSACEQGHAGLSLPGGWTSRVTSRQWTFGRRPATAARRSSWRLSLRPGVNLNPACPFGVEVAVVPAPRTIRAARGPRRPQQIICDAASWKKSWVARTYQPDDFIRPLGMSGHRQDVKKVFTAMGLPPEQRKDWPLIAQGQEVLWVFEGPMSERLKLQASSKKALKIRIFKASPASGFRDGKSR